MPIFRRVAYAPPPPVVQPASAYSPPTYPQPIYPPSTYPVGAYPPANYPPDPAAYPENTYPSASSSSQELNPRSGAYSQNTCANPQSTYPQSTYSQSTYPTTGYPQDTYSQSAVPACQQASYSQPPSYYSNPSTYPVSNPAGVSYSAGYPSAQYPCTTQGQAPYPSSQAPYPTADMYSYSYSTSYSSTGYTPYSNYTSRSYVRGWGPSSDGSSYVPQCPTITDTGAGSASVAPAPAPAPASGKSPLPAVEKKIEVKLPASKRYEELVKECKASGKPWVDKDFQAKNSSLFYEHPPSGYSNIVWKRPHELSAHPKFATGASRLDVQQGSLGDCWLLAAIADLTTNPVLFSRVLPADQTFEKPNYSGVFRFYFWQYGHWVEVLIDDLLPTRNGELIYMKSERGDEFWSSLLEKAYAKLCGSYEALSGGMMSESFEDFTGGIAYRCELRSKAPQDLYGRMLKAHDKGALLGCSIDSAVSTRENQLKNGLIIGHAYSITHVTYVEVTNRKDKVSLLRIRNPWGDEHEWNGAWSDKSSEWSHVSESEKARIGHTNSNAKDGEFWMCFDDFVREFERLEFCLLGPDSAVGATDSTGHQGLKGPEATGRLYAKSWEGTLLEGGWKKRVNAGGCKNYPETFWTNPQYKIHVTADQGGAGQSGGHYPWASDAVGKGTIIVALMQKNRRAMRAEGKEDLSIGFYIYKLAGSEGSSSTLTRQFFDRNKPCAKSSVFSDLREVAEMFRLEPGDYVIVPTSFEPNLEADFVLRVFHESAEHRLREVDEESITVKHDQVPEVVTEPKESETDVKRREEFCAEFERMTSHRRGGAKAEIDAHQLREILNKLYAKELLQGRQFENELCRSLLSLHDPDISGKLDINEYRNLWEDFNGIQKVFKSSDATGHGYINSYELRSVLNSVAEKNPGLKGLRISNSTFRAVAVRFSDSDGKVQFEDFLACVTKLKATILTFKAKSQRLMEPASFHLDEFVQLCVYS